MSTPMNPRRDHSSTYFVQDRSNKEELSRLQIQDQMVTTSMGGVLPEQPDPTIFQRVLDVGCGTGGWLIEAAKTYSTMSLLVGVDVSERMIEYAQAQAEAQQVSDRVQFRTMDALRMLEFPTEYFHLVNQRFGASYLRDSRTCRRAPMRWHIAGAPPKDNAFMRIRGLEKHCCLSSGSGLGCLKTTRRCVNRCSATCNSQTSKRHGGCSLPGGTSPTGNFDRQFSLEGSVPSGLQPSEWWRLSIFLLWQAVRKPPTHY